MTRSTTSASSSTSRHREHPDTVSTPPPDPQDVHELVAELDSALKSRRDRGLLVLATTVLVLGLGVLFVSRQVGSNTERAKMVVGKVATVEKRAEQQGQQITRNTRRGRLTSRAINEIAPVLPAQTRRRLRAIQRGAIPRGEAGARGGTGARGLRGPGPTRAQIDAAIRRCQAAGLCGRPPTAEEIDAAVSRCAAEGRCRGPQGERGSDGVPPPPMDVAAAIARFCGPRDRCFGPRVESFTFSFVDPTGARHTQTCTDPNRDRAYGCLDVVTPRESGTFEEPPPDPSPGSPTTCRPPRTPVSR